MCQSENILVCAIDITVNLLYYSDKHVIFASAVFKIALIGTKFKSRPLKESLTEYLCKIRD